MTGLLVLLAHGGLALVLSAAALALARVSLGPSLRAQVVNEAPRAAAWALLPGAALGGALLGVDALAPELVGPTWAGHAGVRACAAAGAAALAVVPLARGLRVPSAGPRVPEPLRAGLVVLGLTGLVPLALLVGVRRATALDAASYVEVHPSRAALRTWVVPSDGRAHAVLAFRAAGDDRLDDARAALERARGLGEEPAVRLEIEAELAARMGDCETAHHLFRTSLEQRAVTARRFDLRAFRLPPSLASRCPYGGGLSGPRTPANASP